MSSHSTDTTPELVQRASGRPSTAGPATLRDTPPSNASSQRILVYYVGGTIGMIKNAEGSFEPYAGYFTREMRAMRELHASNEVVPLDIIEYDNLIDSSDMNASDYIRIANDIVKHYNNYRGFLVVQGTDTMHFTASALSFLLHNLAKPVIITGSMISLCKPLNDARRNLIIGVMLASNPSICEVCLFFNDSLLRGNRCVKTRHTYDAFETPNYPALGTMVGTRFVIHQQYLLPQPRGPLRMRSDLSGRVMRFQLNIDADVQALCCLLRMSQSKTGMRGDAEEEAEAGPTTAWAPSTQCAKGKEHTDKPSLDHAETHKSTDNNNDNTCNNTKSNNDNTCNNNDNNRQRGALDGLILMVNGMGSLNGEQVRRLRQIHDAAEVHQVVLCIVSNALHGEVISLDQVHQLERLELNLTYLYDMTPFAAETKMMYLFGRGFSPDVVRAYMPRNLRGEMTPCSMCSL